MDGRGRTGSGTEVESNAWSGFRRLHGSRRYDPKDGGGRTESGTEVESNAGAIAEGRCRVERGNHRRIALKSSISAGPGGGFRPTPRRSAD